MAKKQYALVAEEREKECPHEMGFPFSGSMPNTGPKVCKMCGTRQEDAWAADELEVYAVNTSELYPQFLNIIATLARHINRGRYSATRAPQAWRNWYDEAARMYKRELGTSEYRFTAAVRQACAETKAVEEYEAITAGEYDA